MQSNKLEQIFKSRTVWAQGINPYIQHMSEAQYRNYNWWWNCQSRTLNTVLQGTLSNYYRGNCVPYRTLMTMCSLLNNNKLLKIFPSYKLITSEQSEGLAAGLMHILDMPAADTNAFNLYLYHIPKGKSYLRKVLDENTTLNRLKQIETFCIENTQHFIRIYRGFNNTGDNSITVFSDQYSTDLINTLFVMLPHLMGIVSREATEEYELTEEDIKYNEKVAKLNNIFAWLYNIMQEGHGNFTNYDDAQLSHLTAQLQALTTIYADTFDFKTASMDSFTKRLAKARNDNAQRYFTEQLNSVTRRINELEETLKQKYTEQAKFNRELIAHRLIGEDDVKPFIDTIQNTKAIEIVSTSETEMVLRITAPLQYFQEADFTSYENNPTSDYMRAFYNNPTLRAVLHKVFVTREYKLIVQAIIHLQIQDNYNNNPLVISAERQGYSNTAPLTQFPNPHLYHYDCWGPAKTEMQKNMCAGNFELVIMQMVAAVQSINIAEHASFVRGLIGDIQNNSELRNLLTFTVDTPNGTAHLSYKQILEFEKEVEKQNAIQRAEEVIKQAPKQTYTQIEIPDDDANWETPTMQGGNENEEN